MDVKPASDLSLPCRPITTRNAGVAASLDYTEKKASPMSNVSHTEINIRRIVTVLACVGACWGLTHNLPFGYIDPHRQWLLGLFRAVYGAMIVFRCYRATPAAPLVLGWRKTQWVLNRVYLWMIPAAMMCVGFLTPLGILGHILFGSIVWRTSRVYSLEDVLIRSAGFCLLFMNTHLAFSVDSLLGWDFGLSEPSVLGVNFYAWTYASLMLSAGGEKLSSPMWRRGLGFFYFTSLRHWIKPAFHWANKSLVFSWVMSWATIVLQAFLFVSLLVPPMRWLAFPMSLGFATCLCMMVYLAFLAHQTFLSSTLLCIMEFSRWIPTPGAIDPTPAALPALTSPMLWVVIFFILLGILSSSGLFRLRGGWVTGLASWTIALRPIMIFVETHFYGVYTFRLLAKMNGEKRSVLECWTEKGVPSRMQPWRPRTIAGVMYRLSDYCIAVLENVPDRAAVRAETLVDLCYAGYLDVSPEERSKIEEIEIVVRVFDPEDNFVPDTSHWYSKEWSPIGVVKDFATEPRFIPGPLPPRYKKTLRWPVRFE